MEKNFIIYLDIDGVLVSYSNLLDRHPDGKHTFVPKAVEVLNNIITMFNADLCIISTWGRSYWNGKDGNEFDIFLRSRGIIVNNLTFGDPDFRADYIIKKKLEGWKNYLVIDDESYCYFNKLDEISYNRIISTNSWRCLDEYDLIYITRNYTRLIDSEY